jgi:hypothetical protein
MQVVQAAATRTTFESSNNPGVFGEVLTITAVIATDGVIPPTGSVMFTIDGNSFGTQTLNNGRASIMVSTLGLGSHNVVGFYTSNSANFLDSDNSAVPFQQVIVAATGQVDLTSSRNPSSPGALVTFTATVTAPPSSAIPTGSVDFTIDAGPVITRPLDGTGRATISTSTLTLGLHTITATYTSNSANFTGGASDTLQQAIRRDFYAVGTDAGVVGTVNVYDAVTGAQVASLTPYSLFTGGVRVAVADVNADNISDIITMTGPGAGPHLKVFSGANFAEIRSFFAYAPTFTGGAYVAAGDIDGDGLADIITGADAGGGPHVQVFSGATNQQIRSFFAFSPTFTGGVRIASGDVDGDGRDDILVAAGPGGGSHVKVISGMTGAEIRSFFAYGAGYSAGVFVAAGDVNGDGLADIITGAGNIAPHVKVFDGAAGFERASFFAYPGANVGVRVGAVDRTGDGLADIVTGAAASATHVKVFRGTDIATLDSFFAFPGIFRGVFVNGAVP